MTIVVEKLPGGTSADAVVQRLVDAGFSAEHISIEGPAGAPPPAPHERPRLWKRVRSQVVVQSVVGLVIGVIIGIVIVKVMGRGFSFPGHPLASAGLTIIIAALACAVVLALVPLPAYIDVAEDPESRSARGALDLQPGEVTIVVDAGGRETLARSILRAARNSRPVPYT